MPPPGWWGRCRVGARLSRATRRHGLRAATCQPTVSSQWRRKARLSISSSARSRSTSARRSSSMATPVMMVKCASFSSVATSRMIKVCTPSDSASDGIGTRTAHSPLRSGIAVTVTPAIATPSSSTSSAGGAVGPLRTPSQTPARIRVLVSVAIGRPFSKFRTGAAAEGDITQDDLVHLGAFEDQVHPKPLHPLFVHLGIGEVEFHHHLFFVQGKFTHDLFDVRAVLDVQPRKDFQRLFHLDDGIQPDQMLLLQTARSVFGQIDDQRQERSVKTEHIHAKAEGGNICLARVADLADRQLRAAAIMEQGGAIADLRLTGDRG